MNAIFLVFEKFTMKKAIANLAKNFICQFFLESSDTWKNDPKAFLFSLKNPTNNPTKLLQIDSSSSYSVRDNARRGPSFGYGHGKGCIDLRISDRANNKDSYESLECLGSIYTVPSGKLGDPFLTGDKHFVASEIETFYETIRWRKIWELLITFSWS